MNWHITTAQEDQDAHEARKAREAQGSRDPVDLKFDQVNHLAKRIWLKGFFCGVVVTSMLLAVLRLLVSL